MSADTAKLIAEARLYSRYGGDLLDLLADALEAAEAERDAALGLVDSSEWRERAEAAEAERDRVAYALGRIEEELSSPGGAEWERALVIARAALAGSGE